MIVFSTREAIEKMSLA